MERARRARPRLSSSLLAISIAATTTPACRGPAEHRGADGGGPAPSASSPDAEALARAEGAARRLASRLRERLTDASSLGVERAVEVCASEAQGIAAAVRQETGVALGRSSLRLRTPADAPPPWVAEWLGAQGERKAEGVAPVRAVTSGPAGPVARVLLPIAIEPTCLGCHGRREHLASGVRSVLDARYPDDRATGYEIGDLRGALWAEVAVPARP